MTVEVVRLWKTSAETNARSLTEEEGRGGRNKAGRDGRWHGRGKGGRREEKVMMVG